MASIGGNESPAKEKPESKLNAREQELFNIAMMYCLKSGPPQVNYEKFREMGNFNTLKTAQNTWSKIKGKLPVLEVEEEGDGADGGAGAKATPKSTKGSAKKRTASAKKAAEEDEDDDDVATPTKKPRKSSAKKRVVAGPDEEEPLAEEEPTEEE